MNAKAVAYKGVYLMPGSHAHQLWQDKKFKELDYHLQGLEIKKRQLEGKQ